jgi:hypothetical protein
MVEVNPEIWALNRRWLPLLWWFEITRLIIAKKLIQHSPKGTLHFYRNSVMKLSWVLWHSLLSKLWEFSMIMLLRPFIVTGVPDEKRGERLVVLYKAGDDIDGLWKKLQESDLPKLWIPEKKNLHKVEEFPLLGSGKLDMQKLKACAGKLEGLS